MEAPADGPLPSTSVLPTDQEPTDEAARSHVLSDPDLLHHMCSQLVAPAHLAALARVSHTLRSAALSPLLPGWHACNRAAFEEAGPPCEPEPVAESFRAAIARRLLSSPPLPPSRWRAASIAKLLQCKLHLRHLDLSGILIEAPGAAATIVRFLPSTLESLAIRDGCTQPDAMLAALLRSPRLPQLTKLTSLDLSGVATERTLAGMRMLAAPRATDSEDGPLARAARMAIALPSLEQLSVGFHLWTALGAREGAAYLGAQCSTACTPRLKRLGCNFSADALPAAIDIHCGVCGGRLFDGVSSYVVHPPQQTHISYELHTDEPPTPSSVVAMDGDPTRLQCARGCHPTLWLVDMGSGWVTRLLGRRYAVACGPPTGIAGSYRPQLAMACRHGEGDGDVQDVFLPHLPVGRAPPLAHVVQL